MSTLTADERPHFATRGYVRVRGAFSADDAAVMRDVVWRTLEKRGMRRDDPSTWVEWVSHLQHLRGAPAFKAITTDRTVGAIDDILGVDRWRLPSDWGAFFLNIPVAREWTIPRGPWHVDAPYGDPADPPQGVKVHSLFGDVEPRAGGMMVVAGSHLVTERYFAAHPVGPDASAAKLRKALMASDPWLHELRVGTTEPADRIARFFDTTSVVDGVEVQVVELTGDAGDVLLIHPLLLHNRPVNAGAQPRFLLNKDLRVLQPSLSRG